IPCLTNRDLVLARKEQDLFMPFQFLHIAHVSAIDPNAGIAVHTRVALERNLAQNFTVLCLQIRNHAEKLNECEQSHCREEPKSLAHIAPLIGVGHHRTSASYRLSAKISPSSSTTALISRFAPKS